MPCKPDYIDLDRPEDSLAGEARSAGVHSLIHLSNICLS